MFFFFFLVVVVLFCFSDTVFVTLFPTTVETLKDHFIGNLNVDRFRGELTM